MAKYIVLYKFTDQGLKNIKDTVKRADEIRKEQEAHGFTIHGMYWTQGSYDIVTLIDAPDEAAMVAGLLNIAAAGNVHSQSLRAFDAAEMQRILKL